MRRLAVVAAAAVVLGLTTAPASAEDIVPTVASAAPVSGPTPGGTKVQIDGTGFTSDAEVTFGSAPARRVVVKSSRRIFAWTPRNAVPGTVDVRVTTSAGTSVEDIEFTYVGWRSVGTGTQFTCATRTDGTLWCWGRNDSGQLGTTTDSWFTDVPTQVGSDTDWLDVAPGDFHTCATKVDGSAWCWGLNYSGELGTGDTTSRTTPTEVVGGGQWTNVVAGTQSTCGIRADTSLWCWGRNDLGQLGLGDTAERHAPARVGSSGWSEVSLDAFSVCGLRTNQTAWCWGRELGEAAGATTSAVPQRVPSSWTSIDVGHLHACATKANTTLWCWGDNGAGQVGLGDQTERLSPTRVPGRGWSAPDLDGNSSCALRSGTVAWCWGQNYRGALGLGDEESRSVPTRVTPGRWTPITATGNGHSCGLRDNGTLWCSGDNQAGQLGLGDTTSRPVRTLVG